MDWAAKRDWALEEHERRLATPAAEGEREDLRLAGIAGASWAAGLSALMLGEHDEAASLLRRAADEYATSWHAAPPGAWGRPIAMLRCRLIAGDTCANTESLGRHRQGSRDCAALASFFR